LIAEAIELAEAHQNGSPLVGVDAIFLSGYEDRWIDMGANDADLKGDGTGVFVRTMAEGMRGFEDGLKLDGALRDAGRSDECGRRGRELGGFELLLFVAIAHGEFVRGNGIGTCETSEPVDGVYLVDGGQVDDALFFPDEIGGGMSPGAKAEHAVPAQPPGGGHGCDVGCGVRVACREENDRSAEVENGGFHGDVHEAKDG